ncbi:MAG TPA: Hpt domain-containing protein, partial [Methylophilaceae bacterium]|nr:Hpt domain-containing protein [Methylophilaceae bacterium]
MTIDMSQFYQVFFEESEELLAEAEKLLLELDVANPDAEDLNAIFRAAHSIKGGAATFDMVDMTEITHVLETLLDKIRKHEMALTAEHVDAFLAAKDVLTMQLDGHRSGSAVDGAAVDEIKRRLLAFSGQAPGGAATAPVPAAPTVTSAVAPAPVADTLPAGSPRNLLIQLPAMDEKELANLKAELELLGTVAQSLQADGRPAFTLTTAESEDDILAICSFVLDPADLVISAAGSAAPVAAPAGPQTYLIEVPQAAEKDLSSLKDELALLGAVLQSQLADGRHAFTVTTDESATGILAICSFVVDPDSLVLRNIAELAQMPAANLDAADDSYGFFEPLHEQIVKQAGLPAAGSQAAAPAAAQPQLHVVEPAAAPTAAKAPAKREADKQPAAQESSIRVGIEKVDQLINLVGELVITQAMIEQRISALDPMQHEGLVNSVGQLTRNTRDLQEAVMSIRMMPMDYVFSRFPRMVRDLAAKLGKKVEFITQGAATELDKGLIERIVDPLTHLVRNSVDHGIELPEARVKAGKSEAGSLLLSAAHRGGNIVIEVTDDGGGLNRDRILAKARQQGMAVSDSMSDSDVWQLIFAPGFSTAEKVTDISGRGVGMDVVKRNISAMNGVIDIKSAHGFGTTILISLPLTLAILDGMSVSLGDSVYVIPLNLLVETLQPSAADIRTVTGQGRMVRVRGEYLPIIALHVLFNQATDIIDPTKGVLVLIEAEGKKAALFV